MQLTQTDLVNIIFTDYNVESMILDVQSKLAIIKIEGARLKQGSKWIELKHGVLKIFFLE